MTLLPKNNQGDGKEQNLITWFFGRISKVPSNRNIISCNWKVHELFTDIQYVTLASFKNSHEFNKPTTPRSLLKNSNMLKDIFCYSFITLQCLKIPQGTGIRLENNFFPSWENSKKRKIEEIFILKSRKKIECIQYVA